MNKPFTPRAKRVISRANHLAKANNHEYVGSEHVFLAALSETEGMIPWIIKVAGFNREEICEKIMKVAKDTWLING